MNTNTITITAPATDVMTRHAADGRQIILIRDVEIALDAGVAIRFTLAGEKPLAPASKDDTKLEEVSTVEKREPETLKKDRAAVLHALRTEKTISQVEAETGIARKILQRDLLVLREAKKIRKKGVKRNATYVAA